MKDKTRKTAFDILCLVEEESAYSSAEILARENNDRQSGDFIRKLVYGVLERKLYLDYIIDKLSAKGIKSVDKKALAILRMGLYQIIYMDSVPDYAAIDSSVELAREAIKGREGFINAVLRNSLRNGLSLELPSRDKAFSKYLSVYYSIDESIINNWIDAYGEEGCEKIAKGMLEANKLCVRVNLLKTTFDEVKAELENLGLEIEESRLSNRALIIIDTNGIRITDLEIYQDGKISIQSEESIYISDLVSSERGDSVLDVCAAPGGKTAAMAECMLNEGSITSWDIYEHRINRIKPLMERLGIDIVKAEVWDGTEEKTDLLESFDRVLVDAPCSGYGVMGSKPEIRYRKTEEIKELPSIQSKILEVSSGYTKPGGLMVYSTCTINKDENQSIIKSFIDKHKEYTLIKEEQLTPIDGFKGFYVAVLKKN